MRIFLLSAILLLWTQTCYSQERVNAVIPKISNAITRQLNTATGWIYSPEGQWISRKNRIPYFIENQYKSLIDYEHHGLGMDNFVFYQLREINIYDSTWYILIKKYKDGYYKYPSIEKGWTPFNSYYYFVFQKDEWKKLDSVHDGVQNFIKLEPFTQGVLEFANDASFISDIQKSIGKALKDENYKEGELVFQFSPYKKKNIVQFQIYGWDTRLDYPPSVEQEHRALKKGAESMFDTEDIYYTDKLLEHCYFECDYNTFMSFIKFK